jgi:hypothetical protein
MTALPNEILAWIGGTIVSLIGIYLAHISKSIPFKISLGWNKEELKIKKYITVDDLKENCESRQVKLDKKLDAIFRTQEELKNLFMESVLRYEGRISKIEGRILNINGN